MDTVNNEFTIIDKNEMEHVYNNEILPKIEEINKICKLKGIPFFYAFVTGNDEHGTEYKYDSCMSYTNDINLKDDKMAEFTLIMLGCKAERPGVVKSFNDEATMYISENVEEE